MHDDMIKAGLEQFNRRALLRQSLIAGSGLMGMTVGMTTGMTGGAFAAESSPAAKVRRVVTANNAKGKSYFVSDEWVSPSAEIWRTAADEPLGKRSKDEPAAWLPSTAPNVDPSPGGSRWTFATISPWTEMRPRFESGAIAGHDRRGFHRTSSIDYVYVTNGELHLLIDEGEVTLHGGDMVIQRNTLHSWQNHTNTPVVILATLVRPTDR